MLEQIDHRGKRFMIDDDDIVDDGKIDCCRRADALERQAQRERRELECAKAVAGPAGVNPDVAAASRDCLVHADTKTGEAGELLTHVKNNRLYVPVGDFDTKYREYAKRAFKKLLRVQEENLSEDQLMWLTTNESAITERIDRFIETGHHERIWRDWNPGERTICVLRDAIRDAPDEDVSLGEFYSAKELFEAVEAYDPEADWKRDVCNRISSPRSLEVQIQFRWKF